MNEEGKNCRETGKMERSKVSELVNVERAELGVKLDFSGVGISKRSV